MEAVYIAAIIAIAVLVVVYLYRNRIWKGTMTVKPGQISASVDAKPGASDAEGTAGTPHMRQDGKTVIDDDVLVQSRVSAPRDADLKIRNSGIFGSSIDIRDAPAEEKKDDPRT